MKKVILEYYAVFSYESGHDDDGPAIFFPDIPGCVSCASSTDEGIRMAKDALGLWLHGTQYNELPPARPPSESCRIIPVRISFDRLNMRTSPSQNNNFEYYAILIDYLCRKDIIIPDFPDADLKFENNMDNTDLIGWLENSLEYHIKNNVRGTIPPPRKIDKVFRQILIKEEVEVDEQGFIRATGCCSYACLNEISLENSGTMTVLDF